MRRVVVISHSAISAANRKKWHYFQKKKWSIQLLVPSTWKEGRHKLRAERESSVPYRVFSQNVIFPGRLGLYVFPGLEAFLSTRKPDILFLEEEPWSFVARQAIAFAKKRKIPVGLITAEGKMMRQYPFHYRRNLAFSVPSLSFVFSETQAGKDLVRKFGYSGEVIFSHVHGIDDKIFAPQLKRKRATYVIGYVGRLVPEKGVIDLLQAVAKVKKARLLCVGDGPERKRLQNMAERLRLQASFPGFVPQTRLPSYYAEMDIFVLPSKSTSKWAEGINRSLLQAMACGICCVGSSCGGTRELLKGCGMLYQEGDVTALASILNELLSNPKEREKLAIQGYDRVKSHYTVQKVAEKLEDVLNHF